jgi:hypothetical protein
VLSRNAYLLRVQLCQCIYRRFSVEVSSRCYMKDSSGMGGPFVNDFAGLGSYWLYKSLMYSWISVRVYFAAANSPSISLYRVQRESGGDMCCR